jgi:hypothetical protein
MEQEWSMPRQREEGTRCHRKEPRSRTGPSTLHSKKKIKRNKKKDGLAFTNKERPKNNNNKKKELKNVRAVQVTPVGT